MLDFCAVNATAFFVNFFIHSPRWYLNKQLKWLSIPNTLSETKICNLHPWARQQAFPSFLWESPPPPPHQVHDMSLRLIMIITTLWLSIAAFPTLVLLYCSATSNAAGDLSSESSSILILARCPSFSSFFPSILLNKPVLIKRVMMERKWILCYLCSPRLIYWLTYRPTYIDRHATDISVNISVDASADISVERRSICQLTIGWYLVSIYDRIYRLADPHFVWKPLDHYTNSTH